MFQYFLGFRTNFCIIFFVYDSFSDWKITFYYFFRSPFESQLHPPFSRKPHLFYLNSNSSVFKTTYGFILPFIVLKCLTCGSLPSTDRQKHLGLEYISHLTCTHRPPEFRAHSKCSLIISRIINCYNCCCEQALWQVRPRCMQNAYSIILRAWELNRVGEMIAVFVIEQKPRYYP